MADESSSSRRFARLYEATVAPLRRHLSRMLGSDAEAEDVAHDAYLRVYPTIAKDEAQKPEALLYTTARRLAFNRLKRRRIAPVSTTSMPMEAAPSHSPGVVQQVMARQELQQLELAIAQLPEGCRTVLLLRKIELLSHQEISERLGIAISTVEKQHARALRLLRALLAAPAATPAAHCSEAQT
jgi:RNA polymerase sigma factor (sigma-70 family)